MNPREPQADDGAKPTRRDVAAHGALASTDLAYERLQQLFEISKLLTRYESLDRTLPAVLQLVAGTLSLRSSILLLRSAVPGRPRALEWHVAGADGERLATAKASALRSYVYFVPSDVDATSGVSAEGFELLGERSSSQRFFFLPLVVDKDGPFGGLQVEAWGEFDELDLFFVNAVVNQIAVAVDRQRVVDARQATSDRARAAAEAKQVVAEEAKEAIRRETGLARDVTNCLGEGVIGVDLERRVTVFNPVAEQLLGVSADEVLGRPIDAVVVVRMASAGLSDTSKDVFGTVIGSGQPVRSDESLLSTVGGPFLAVSYTCTPLQRAGPLAGAVFVFRDVLAVKVAEKEQRALADASAILGSSLDYRDILARVTRSAVPLLADLCFIDELGQDGVARRFDVAFADPLKQGEWAEQVKRCSPHPGWQTPQSQVIESGRAVLLAEYEDPSAVAHDDEHARISAAIGPKSVMVVPLLARERVLGAFTFIMAESNRRYSPRDLRLAEEIGHRAALAIDNARLYEHAQSATRLRDELLAIVSHDLKSPLSAIVMCAESLKQLPDGQVDPRRARRQLASILRAADRMNLLIRDLLDTASIEAGHLSLDVRPLDVASLISDALDQHAELAEAKSIQLERQIAENLPTVVGDAARLQQVLANVLGNGLKFTPPFGTITVAASGSGDLITISVADTGPGIDPADLDHLFDRFWQAGQTARLGTGLGLFIVQHIVNAHGGRVWAESQLGAGTTLSLELPIAGSRGVRSITT